MTLQPGVDHLGLRPAGPSDEPFLLDLYRHQHGLALAALPLPQQQILLPLQFRARQQSYTQTYPASTDRLVLLDDAPIGRLWTADLPREHRIVDLALLPHHCGAGIGTCLLTSEIRRAAQAGKPLRLSVHRTNERARQLYARLGFLLVEDDPVHLTFEVRTGTVST